MSYEVTARVPSPMNPTLQRMLDEPEWTLTRHDDGSFSVAFPDDEWLSLPDDYADEMLIIDLD